MLRVLCIGLVAAVGLINVCEGQYSAENYQQDYQQRSSLGDEEGTGSYEQEEIAESVPLMSVERMMFPGLFGGQGQGINGLFGNSGQNNRQNPAGLGSLTNLFNGFGNMFRPQQGGGGMSVESRSGAGAGGMQQRSPFNFNFSTPNWGRMFGQLLNANNNRLANPVNPPAAAPAAVNAVKAPASS